MTFFTLKIFSTDSLPHEILFGCACLVWKHWRDDGAFLGATKGGVSSHGLSCLLLQAQGTFLCFAPSERSVHMAWKCGWFLLDIEGCTCFCFGMGQDQTRSTSHCLSYCWQAHGYRGEGSGAGSGRNQSRHSGCGAVSQLQPPPDAAAEHSKTEQQDFVLKRWGALPLLPQHGLISRRTGLRQPS